MLNNALVPRKRGDHASFSIYPSQRALLYQQEPGPLFLKHSCASPLSKADRLRHRMTSAISTWGTADHVHHRRLSQILPPQLPLTNKHHSGDSRRRTATPNKHLADSQRHCRYNTTHNYDPDTRRKNVKRLKSVKVPGDSPKATIYLDLSPGLIESESLTRGVSTETSSFLRELGSIYDDFYPCDQSTRSLADLDSALLSCGKGLIEVERTLHHWMTIPFRQRPLPETISFASGRVPAEATTCVEYYLPDPTNSEEEEDVLPSQDMSSKTRPKFGRPSDEGGDDCESSSTQSSVASGCQQRGSSSECCCGRALQGGRSFTGLAGDPGPSFFVTVELPNSEIKRRWENLAYSASLAIPFISDCYDEFESPEEYTLAWSLLGQSAVQVVTPHHPVVLSICCRDFVQFAVASMEVTGSRKLSNGKPFRRHSITGIHNTHPPAAKAHVAVKPLCNRLWWSNAEDRLLLHDFTYGIAAWVRVTDFASTI